MSDIAIRVENLGKAYRIASSAGGKRYKTLQEDLLGFLKNPLRRGEKAETFWALKDVSFEVKHGEVLGIIGRNGAGKSTLLKILSRITRPTTGHADVYGRVGSLLEVGTGFHPELTGRENIYLNGAILGMSRAEIARRFDEIVAFAEVEQFLDTPAKRYSSGMYMRLAFAVAAHLDPEVLIVDEVLAVGDAEFQKKCLGKMSEVASSGRTVLFVSHNMGAVEALCSKAVWLNHGQIVEQDRVDVVIPNYLTHSIDNRTDQYFPDIDTAPGNDRIRVRKMRIAPIGDGDDAQISMSTPVELEFEFWCLQPRTFLNLSLIFSTGEGVIAFNTAPVHDVFWLNNPYPKGLFRSSCKIPGALFNSGTYYVKLLFVENQAHVIYSIDEALVFEVSESIKSRGDSTWFGKWPGVIHPELEWQTQRIEA